MTGEYRSQDLLLKAVRGFRKALNFAGDRDFKSALLAFGHAEFIRGIVAHRDTTGSSERVARVAARVGLAIADAVADPTCYVCFRAVPPNDRLPFLTGVAHAACAIERQLAESPTGKVVTSVVRKGPAFDGRVGR